MDVLPVLYCDERLAVVNKPAGLMVHDSAWPAARPTSPPIACASSSVAPCSCCTGSIAPPAAA